ncbi:MULTISPECIES: hypothetical protein [unclassified Sphingomonas]|uniref:hypothetical protein n=1 Tax=unclassified Sphingomonas TaxID=196159 RepID=UPI0006F24D63|nr:MULTISPECIES: hypothetical protein [unclassified Sphingomonas]KQS51558.1 hypothetical protein ASG20_06065 [Sphingomonas sp. Leaf198]RMB35646.1 hypothetical protein C8J47_1161 [Sphingomonas sp. PP-F2F-G114-C0414]
MRRVISIGVVAAGTVLLIAFLVFLRKPIVDAGENGMFANDCCGTVKLADGEMLLNGQRTISYIVARDADGPYILPRFDVGVVSDQGLDVDGTRSVRKLRLDRLPSATKLTLHEGLTPYVFKRLTPHLRN